MASKKALSAYREAQLAARALAGSLSQQSAAAIEASLKAYAARLAQLLAGLPPGDPTALKLAKSHEIVVQSAAQLHQRLQLAVDQKRRVAFREVMEVWQYGGNAAAEAVGVPGALLGELTVPSVTLAGAYENLGGSATWKTKLTQHALAGMEDVDGIVREALLLGVSPEQLGMRLRPYVQGAQDFYEAFAGEDFAELRARLEDLRSGVPAALRESGRKMAGNARRIAYSEVFNAREEATLTAMAADPLVEAVQWKLSPFRGQLDGPDICDALAVNDFYGMGPGVYPLHAVPVPPHPYDRCERWPVLRAPENAHLPKPKPGMVLDPSKAVLVPKGRGYAPGKKTPWGAPTVLTSQQAATRRSQLKTLLLQSAQGPASHGMAQLMAVVETKAQQAAVSLGLGELGQLQQVKNTLDLLAKDGGLLQPATLNMPVVSGEKLYAVDSLWDQQLVPQLKALGVDVGAESGYFTEQVVLVGKKQLVVSGEVNVANVKAKLSLFTKELKEPPTILAYQHEGLLVVAPGEEATAVAAHVMQKPVTLVIVDVDKAVAKVAQLEAAKAAEEAGLAAAKKALEQEATAAKLAQVAKAAEPKQPLELLSAKMDLEQLVAQDGDEINMAALGFTVETEDTLAMVEARFQKMMDHLPDGVAKNLPHEVEVLVSPKSIVAHETADASFTESALDDIMGVGGEADMFEMPVVRVRGQLYPLGESHRALAYELLGKPAKVTIYDMQTVEALVAQHAPDFELPPLPVGLKQVAKKAEAALVTEALPAPTAVVNTQQLTAEQVLGKKLAGPTGSNTKGHSGLWQGTDGVKRYVKEYNDPAQAYTEQLANTIYRRLGVAAPESSVVVTADGRTLFASTYMDNAVGTLGSTGLTKAKAQQVMDGYVADVLLANRDAVGTGLDNIVLTSTGQAVRIDQGGALLFRAQGVKKELTGPVLQEWESLLSSGTNSHYSQVAKAAGVTSGESLGVKALAQLDAVMALEKEAGGWAQLVEQTVPGMEAKAKKATVKMLEERSAALKVKRAALGKQLGVEAEALAPTPVTPLQALKAAPDILPAAAGEPVALGVGGADWKYAQAIVDADPTIENQQLLKMVKAGYPESPMTAKQASNVKMTLYKKLKAKGVLPEHVPKKPMPPLPTVTPKAAIVTPVAELVPQGTLATGGGDALSATLLKVQDAKWLKGATFTEVTEAGLTLGLETIGTKWEAAVLPKVALAIEDRSWNALTLLMKSGELDGWKSHPKLLDIMLRRGTQVAAAGLNKDFKVVWGALQKLEVVAAGETELAATMELLQEAADVLGVDLNKKALVQATATDMQLLAIDLRKYAVGRIGVPKAVIVNGMPMVENLDSLTYALKSGMGSIAGHGTTFVELGLADAVSPLLSAPVVAAPAVTPAVGGFVLDESASALLVNVETAKTQMQLSAALKDFGITTDFPPNINFAKAKDFIVEKLTSPMPLQAVKEATWVKAVDGEAMQALYTWNESAVAAVTKDVVAQATTVDAALSAAPKLMPEPWPGAYSHFGPQAFAAVPKAEALLQEAAALVAAGKPEGQLLAIELLGPSGGISKLEEQLVASVTYQKAAKITSQSLYKLGIEVPQVAIDAMGQQEKKALLTLVTRARAGNGIALDQLEGIYGKGSADNLRAWMAKTKVKYGKKVGSLKSELVANNGAGPLLPTPVGPKTVPVPAVTKAGNPTTWAVPNTPAKPSSALPWQVTEPEAAAFVADSDIQQPLYFQGATKTTEALESGALDFTKTPDTSWGHGFYLETAPTDLKFGTSKYNAYAVKAKKVLRGTATQLDQELARLGVVGTPEAKLARLQELGYDAVVQVDSTGKPMKVMVTRKEAVKLVKTTKPIKAANQLDKVANVEAIEVPPRVLSPAERAQVDRAGAQLDGLFKSKPQLKAKLAGGTARRMEQRSELHTSLQAGRSRFIESELKAKYGADFSRLQTTFDNLFDGWYGSSDSGGAVVLKELAEVSGNAQTRTTYHNGFFDHNEVLRDKLYVTHLRSALREKGLTMEQAMDFYLADVAYNRAVLQRAFPSGKIIVRRGVQSDFFVAQGMQVPKRGDRLVLGMNSVSSFSLKDSWNWSGLILKAEVSVEDAAHLHFTTRSVHHWQEHEIWVLGRPMTFTVE